MSNGNFRTERKVSVGDTGKIGEVEDKRAEIIQTE